MKTPEIRVLEALLSVCAQFARGADLEVARAASQRHARLSAEHARLMRDLPDEPESGPQEPPPPMDQEARAAAAAVAA